MKKTLLLSVGLSLIVSITATAAEINWDELEKKAQQYTGETAGSSNEKRSSLGEKAKSLNLTLPGQPQGRTVDNSPRELSEADKRHITVHMKLANRHFARKNYQKAIEEAELVFEREPANVGARFMRAVIAGRLRDHQTAWYNILIAREHDPSNPKISSFISKLATVSPEPANPVWVPGVFRSIPVSASEKACDIFESLLNNPVSHNITGIQTSDFAESAGSVKLPVKFEFSSAPDKSGLLNALRKATTDEVIIDSEEGNNLSLSLTIKGPGISNQSVKPVSNLREFVKNITEEIDVAISDTVERETDNKQLEIVYEISTRSFATLNDFLRKISPYAISFRIQSMKLAYITGTQSIIWKCKVQVFFKLS